MPLYAAPERTDILENGLIRFTHISAFNDPFETFPCFTAELPDEHIQEFLRNHKPDSRELEQMFRASFESEMSKVPTVKISYEAIKDLPFVKTALSQIGPMVGSLFKQFMSGKGELFSRYTVRMALEAINKQFGLLCPSEKPNNLLMWARKTSLSTIRMV